MAHKAIFNFIMNDRVQAWYKEHINEDFLYNLREKAEEQGFCFDPDSGLIIRKPYDKEIEQKLDRTIIDIIFPRPTDLHLHQDFGEAFYVEDGSGVLFEKKPGENLYTRTLLFPGKCFYVEKNTEHALRPNRDDILDVRVTTTGIMDLKNEKTIQGFDEFAPWLEYYDGVKER